MCSDAIGFALVVWIVIIQRNINTSRLSLISEIEEFKIVSNWEQTSKNLITIIETLFIFSNLFWDALTLIKAKQIIPKT